MPDGVDYKSLEGSLSGNLEENVIAALAWHEELAPLLASRLEPTIFSTKAYRDIAKASIDYLLRYKRPPKAHLPDLLEKEIERGSAGRLLRTVLERMQNLAPELNADFIADQVDGFIEYRLMGQAIEEAATAWNNGNVEKAREAMFTQRAAEESSIGTFLHEPEKSLRFLDENENDVFSTGVRALDEARILLKRATVTMLIGTVKSGKSWWLVGVGKAALMQRKSVLHITLENSERLTSRRYVQAVMGMTAWQATSKRHYYFDLTRRGDFQKGYFEDVDVEGLQQVDRKILANRLRRLKRRPPLLIKEFPTGTLTLARLSAFIRMLKQLHNFVPDILLVDYPDLMSISSDNLRVETGRIIQGIRGLCNEHNMAGAIVSQGNRASFRAPRTHGGMVAEDYSKLGTVDTVLAYSQTEREREYGTARISVEASREARDKFIVLVTQDYETGQFCLDSVVMNKAAEKWLSGITKEGHNDEDEEDDEEDAPRQSQRRESRQEKPGGKDWRNDRRRN